MNLGFSAGGSLKDEEIYNYASKLIGDFDIRSGEGADTIPLWYVRRQPARGNRGKGDIQGPDILLAVQPPEGWMWAPSEYIHRELVKQRDAGAAILLISLELDEVMNLNDRILVMFEGNHCG